MGGAGTLFSWRPGRRTVGLSALAPVLLLLSLMVGGAGVAQAAPAFEAHGSVEQVYATGVAPGANVTLYNGSGGTVASKPADELGAVLFRDVTPGSGYPLRVRSPPARPGEAPR